jgi:hypothetical protein
VGVAFFLTTIITYFTLQKYTFFLERQNQLSEPTVLVPMNIDGDTRLLMFFAAFYLFHRCSRPCRQAVVFVGFLLVGGEGRAI